MAEKNNIKIQLGKRIKELRLKKKLTQEQLAEMIGVGERNLSKIECGNNFITSNTLSQLLLALEVSAKYLFDFETQQDESFLKKELINAIKNNEIDIKLLYKFYQSIK